MPYDVSADLDGTQRTDGSPLAHRYAQFAVDFISNATTKGDNFLVYLAFSHMHVPIVHSPRYSGKSNKGVLGDALVELDDAVGILLNGLDSTGVRDNTIIFVTGDNGPPQVFVV